MTTQTEAERLADDLVIDYFGDALAYEAAAELRRLASLNKDLMDEVARLKALAEQPAQQEPVAWLDGPHLVMRSDWRDRANYKGPWVDFGRAIPDSWVPVLYTTPQPPAQPLTNEQIDAKFDAFASKFDHESNEWLDMGVDAYFRAGFKAAHGITKGNT